MAATTNGSGILEQFLGRIRRGRPGRPALTEGATTDALVRVLSDHLAHEAEAQLAERRRLAAEHAQLVAAEDVAGPARQARLAEARARIDEAMEAARAIEREYNAIRLQGLGESVAVAHRRGLLEAELRETADPRIAAFLEETTEVSAWKALQVESRTNRLTGEVRTFTNRASVEGAIVAIRAARTAAAALQVEALDETTITERLAELRASIPPIAPVAMPEGTRAEAWV